MVGVSSPEILILCGQFRLFLCQGRIIHDFFFCQEQTEQKSNYIHSYFICACHNSEPISKEHCNEWWDTDGEYGLLSHPLQIWTQ